MREKKFDLLEFLLILLRHKKLLILNLVAITIIAVVYSYTIDKTYMATTVFLPPDVGSGSGLAALMPNFAVDILGGNDITKRQLVTILHSRELKEQIIEEFDLVHVYETEETPNYLEKAIRALEGNTTIKVSEEGGLGFSDITSISISILDKDSVRCAEMANRYVTIADDRIRELNSRKASENRAFIEQQIAISQDKLVQARSKLNQFQLENRLYSIPEQTKLVLQTVGELKSKMLSLETRRAYLLRQHAPAHPLIKDVNVQIAILDKEISQLEKKEKPDLLMGLEKSLELGNGYADRYIDVETLTGVITLLRQQLEQARIQENKAVSSVRIVDHARPPQWKAKPKKAFVVLTIVTLYMFGLVLVVLARKRYKKLRNNNPDAVAKIDEFLSHIVPKFKRSR